MAAPEFASVEVSARSIAPNKRAPTQYMLRRGPLVRVHGRTFAGPDPRISHADTPVYPQVYTFEQPFSLAEQDR